MPCSVLGLVMYGFVLQVPGTLIDNKATLSKHFPREIAIFDSDDNFVHSFTNSAFLLPCSVAFNTDTKEAYVLGE